MIFFRCSGSCCCHDQLVVSAGVESFKTRPELKTLWSSARPPHYHHTHTLHHTPLDPEHLSSDNLRWKLFSYSVDCTLRLVVWYKVHILENFAQRLASISVSIYSSQAWHSEPRQRCEVSRDVAICVLLILRKRNIRNSPQFRVIKCK